ncbi:MAG: tetratricopeptide repeat protein [Thermoanaerobaculia bacterium]|nr:tetratricopeptide repeat protein [Thermoanaerobaculia bacterium]
MATRTLELEPESVRALYLVGSAAERTGRFERAAEAFKRLLDLEPDYAPALNYLGYLWAERGENLETARQLIEKAVALEPDNGAYVDSLGWVYFQLGRYPEARRHLQWAAKLLPEDATVWEHLGDLSVKMGEIEPARAAYRKAIEVGADDPDKLQAKLQELAATAP